MPHQDKHDIIEVLHDWFPTDPMLWQIVKSVHKFGVQAGTVEDLIEARQYLNRFIDMLKKNPSELTEEQKDAICSDRYEAQLAQFRNRL